MKVHLLDHAAVHRALGVQKARIHRPGIFPDRPRKRRSIQKGHDLGRTCAAVRMLCMRRVCALLLPVDAYGDVRTADAALGIRRGRHDRPAAIPARNAAGSGCSSSSAAVSISPAQPMEQSIYKVFIRSPPSLSGPVGWWKSIRTALQ